MTSNRAFRGVTYIRTYPRKGEEEKKIAGNKRPVKGERRKKIEIVQ